MDLKDDTLPIFFKMKMLNLRRYFWKLPPFFKILHCLHTILFSLNNHNRITTTVLPTANWLFSAWILVGQIKRPLILLSLQPRTKFWLFWNRISIIFLSILVPKNKENLIIHHFKTCLFRSFDKKFNYKPRTQQR